MKKSILTLLLHIILMICVPACESVKLIPSLTPTVIPSNNDSIVQETKPALVNTLPEESETPITKKTKSIEPSPAFTEKRSPYSYAEYNNMEIETDNEERNPDGRIVLEGMSCLDLTNEVTYPVQNLSYIWDLQTDKKWDLNIDITEEIWKFAISPDQTKLAYWIFDYKDLSLNYQLRIVDNNGIKFYESVYPYTEWMDLIDWYDDSFIMLNKNYFSDELIRKPPSAIVVYNPFTQETLTQYSSESFMNISNQTPGAGGWGKYYYSEMVLSPDYRYAAYFAKKFHLNLWNIEENRLIAEIDPGTREFGPPEWFQDSQSFVVDLYSNPELSDVRQTDEIFKVDIKGDVKRLSYLSDIFEKHEICHPSLSPNGKMVAFNLLTNETDPEYRIALLDIETNKVTIFTNLIPFRFYDQMTYRQPVWSPDSNQFMVIVNKKSGEGYRTALVDLEENYALQLAEDVKPVGWIMSDNDK